MTNAFIILQPLKPFAGSIKIRVAKYGSCIQLGLKK